MAQKIIHTVNEDLFETAKLSQTNTSHVESFQATERDKDYSDSLLKQKKNRPGLMKPNLRLLF